MENEKISLVTKMKSFAEENYQSGITAEDIARHVGYSKVHCMRLFREFTGKGISEYIRLLRLTNAAKEMQSSEANILDTALEHNFDSHEGFTKAFSSAFGITPSVYRKGERAIKYFIPYPVAPERLLKRGGGKMERIVTATIVSKEERLLIFQPSKAGKDYWSYCQEMGCDWEGLLLSIKGRFDTPAFMLLPDSLIPEGFGEGAAGIEVPAGYKGEVPEDYMTAVLPACEMIYFQSAPFENDEEFGTAIGEVYKAYEEYNPESFGYKFDSSIAPIMNFGAEKEKGAKIAVPIRRI